MGYDGVTLFLEQISGALFQAPTKHVKQGSERIKYLAGLEIGRFAGGASMADLFLLSEA